MRLKSTIPGNATGARSPVSTEANRTASWKTLWPSDLDTAFQYLSSQAGVNREAIGAGGAGNLGVAECHLRSVAVLLSETGSNSLASQLPGVDAGVSTGPGGMKLLYITASSPIKKLVHYSQAEDAPAGTTVIAKPPRADTEPTCSSRIRSCRGSIVDG